MSAHRRLRFERFELDPDTGDLNFDGSPVALEQQPARVLVALATAGGQLVSRDELRRAVWVDGVHVDFDGGLNY